jgi:hypothetical protein
MAVEATYSTRSSLRGYETNSSNEGIRKAHKNALKVIALVLLERLHLNK